MLISYFKKYRTAINRIGGGGLISALAVGLSFLLVALTPAIAYGVPGAPQPPTADANGSYECIVGETITLDASGSSDPNNDIVSYKWDVDGDYSYEKTSETATVDVVPTDLADLETGTEYTIRVKVTDSEGAYDTASSTLTVNPVSVEVGIYRDSKTNFLFDMNDNGKWDGVDIDYYNPFGFKQDDDIPLVGDIDGDGVDEAGVYRNSRTYFLFDKNNNGKWDGPSVDYYNEFGFRSDDDKPLVGDVDGDGTDEVGVYRNSRTYFLFDLNDNGKWNGPSTDFYNAFGFRVDDDLPLTGDINGDGTDEVGVYRNSKTYFLFDLNDNGKWDGVGTDFYNAFGFKAEDVPLVGNLPDSSAISTATGMSGVAAVKSGLSLTSVLAYPNPVAVSDTVTFQAQGDGISEMKVEVFTSSGSRVFSSGIVEGRSVAWDLSAEGSNVSNGIYLYNVSVFGQGESLTGDVNKLLILR